MVFHFPNSSPNNVRNNFHRISKMFAKPAHFGLINAKQNDFTSSRIVRGLRSLVSSSFPPSEYEMPALGFQK